jgi:hypothetical protein
MKRVLPLCLVAITAATAFAQQQEQGLIERIDAKGKLAIQSMDGRSKSNPALASDLSNKGFTTSSASMKTFSTSSFGGVKSAPIKTFETRSFFGVKNPWFGKKVFDTYASTATSRTAGEGNKKFQTEAFAVSEYDKSSRKDLVDANTLPSQDTKPRPYLVQPKAEGGVSRFTENLHKDLSIDDVRDLLNKGRGE